MAGWIFDVKIVAAESILLINNSRKIWIADISRDSIGHSFKVPTENTIISIMLPSVALFKPTVHDASDEIVNVQDL